MEIDSRLLPPSLYGTFRQVLQGGDFGETKPTEEFHIDQLSQLRLDSSILLINETSLASTGFSAGSISSEVIQTRPAFDRVSASGISMISPRITREAYPMKHGRSGKQLPSRSAMSRYASCNSVVTLRVTGDPRRASSRFAIRCNPGYRVLNSSSAAAPSPHSASLISEEIVGPTRHLPNAPKCLSASRISKGQSRYPACPAHRQARCAVTIGVQRTAVEHLLGRQPLQANK